MSVGKCEGRVHVAPPSFPAVEVRAQERVDHLQRRPGKGEIQSSCMVMTARGP